MPWLIAITFLSAFLLFQIELVIAKLFLPNYGGSFLVWGACIVFFQAVLMAGYIFSHVFLQRLGIKSYLRLHLFLLFVPFLFFPISYSHLSFAPSSIPLVFDIFWRLIITIGPVFLVLSTMSLVTQSWLAASDSKEKTNPYVLYSVSNLASFCALLTYPFIFEQYLTNTQQLHIWRILYLMLVAVNMIAWRFVKTSPQSMAQEATKVNPIATGTMMRWLIMGAAGVVMFLSVTNIVTYEVAPVPLLWVIPLGIYLMAFVLNFKKNPWYPRWIDRFIGPLIGMGALMYFVSQKQHLLPVLLVIIFHALLLFLICMYIQHRLIEEKPLENHQMTFFYVMLSLGGFLGGILTSWIIPLISNTLIEYLTGLLMVALIIPKAAKPQALWISILALLAVAVAFILWPHWVSEYHLSSFAFLLVVVWWAFTLLACDKKFLIGGLLGIILITPWLESIWQDAHFIMKKRNYYGIYEVYDSKHGVRIMLHGTTLHGIEFVDEERRPIPLGYYSPLSPIGSLLLADVFQAKRVGVVGLGTGALSMYSKLNCPVDYYELDADVKDLASKYFWYLSDAPGDVNIILGDARISLNKSPDAAYDILVVDAFSGDAIPTHLVNKDVLLEYRQKLTQRGAIVFHITNRYLNLEPVLDRIAEYSNAYAAIKDVGDMGVNMRSIWCVLTWDSDRYLKLITQEGWEPLDISPVHRVRLWTDDYSTILPIINMNELAVSLKAFKPLTW